jgi:enoyl-CoA hydratase/carnithine racemase
MKSYTDVRLEMPEDGGVAVVTIDRPERRNALGSAAAAELRAAIEEASFARVIILTGSGGSFCAGGDLEELAHWNDLSEEEIAGALYESFQGMIRAIRRSPAIVIAAVPGAAVGAGMDLALACDLRIASSDARFGQVWVRLGVIPGTGGAWMTQHLLGPTLAADLLLTGRLMDATEALRVGLVNEVVEPDALMGAAHVWAQRVLGNPREGVTENKRAMVAAADAGLEAALEHAREVQPGRFTSEEFRTAVKQARR